MKTKSKPSSHHKLSSNYNTILISIIKKTAKLPSSIETKLAIANLRSALRWLGNLAAFERKLPPPSWPVELENLPPCPTCGHIFPHSHET